MSCERALLTFLSLVVLSFPLPSNAAPDAFEPDDEPEQASPIRCGDTQTRSIDPEGDIDYVTLTLDAPADVVIETSGVEGDTILQLGDSNSNLLEENDDFGFDTFSRIDRVCGTDRLAAGSYIIAVLGIDDNEQIDHYDFHVTCTPCSKPDPALDAFEPDDSPETAKSISCGETQDRNLLPAGDADLVSFHLDGASSVVLETSGSHGDTTLDLADDQLDIIESNDDRGIGLFSRIERECGVDALPSGSYTALVQEFDGNALGAYQLSLTCQPCALPNPEPDGFEPDDDPDQAETIRCGETQRRNILPSGDADFIELSLSAPMDVRIETKGTTGDTVLYLVDGDGTIIESDDDSGQGQFSRLDRQCGSDALEEGSYFIAVGDFGDNDPVAAYDLSVTCEPCSTANPTPTRIPTPLPSPSPDSFEPDDDSPQAHSISCGETQRRSIVPIGDSDVITFTLDEPSEVVVETSAPVGDTLLTLLGPEDEFIAQDDDGGEGLASRIVTKCDNDTLGAGTYVFGVREFGDDAAIGAYEVTLTCVSCPITGTTASPSPTRTPTPTGTPRPTNTPAPCVGDCDGDTIVDVAELIRGVRIALGIGSLECTGLDANEDGTITVDELVRAVNSAISGCTA